MSRANGYDVWSVVTEDLGPFESKALALQRALYEYLETNQ
jgi:hypothetical protein